VEQVLLTLLQQLLFYSIFGSFIHGGKLEMTTLFYSIFGSFIHGGKPEMTTNRFDFSSILHSSLLALDIGVRVCM